MVVKIDYGLRDHATPWSAAAWRCFGLDQARSMLKRRKPPHSKV